MMTEYETKPGYKKQPQIQRIQLKNKLVLVDPRVLDKPPAIEGYKEMEKPADALSKTLLNTNISRIYRNESISCLLYTSPSPRDGLLSRMPSSA